MEYNFNEYCDMIWVLGECRGNVNEAVMLYAERYPNRRHPNHGVIRRVDQRARETGNFGNRQGPDRGRPRFVRNPNLEELVINAIEDEPGASTRGIGQMFNVSKSTVHRIFKEDGLYPYHKTRVQTLSAGDFPLRVQFCEWLIRESDREPNFIEKILWTDEATFTRDGIFNTRNTHEWSRINPHALVQKNNQNRFGLNVWAGRLFNY